MRSKNHRTQWIVMIRPVQFGWNEETAKTNHFQSELSFTFEEIQHRAVLEFDRTTSLLRQHGLKVTVIEDIRERSTPDSIFPNNWFSTHPNGELILYPMQAKNRRRERRMDVFDVLANEGWQMKSTIDLSSWEEQGIYLEGTGSLVLARDAGIAYAALSERTHKEAVLAWCEKMNFRPVIFDAYDTLNGEKLPIYHTNVVLCVGQLWAIVCFEAMSIEDGERIDQSLRELGREVIPISLDQMRNFAANMLELEGVNGPLVVMSETARQALNAQQIGTLMKYAEILAVPIPTIEKIGGGSARCMIAEIF